MTSSVLGIDTQTGQRVEIPKSSRLQGLYIIGSTGTGKSGLIENLIVQDIKQGVGVCVLDPHGDLIKAVLERMDRREDDVIFLDITDYHYPFGINLFSCSDPTNPLKVQEIVEQVKHIFEKLLGVSTSTPLILEYLLKCTQTLIANPGYTMAEIPLLLQDAQCRKRLVANVSDIDVIMFWKRFEGKRPIDREEEAAGVLRRVSEFLQPLTRNIVGQSTSSIDLQNIMDEGKILLVKLSAQYQSISNLIGSILIALTLNAMYARQANKRRQFNLYADEFQRFATDDFATLLTEARKFGIATTIAHQARYQPGMTDGIRATTVGAANLVVFRVQPEDATELAGRFDITPQEAWEEELEEEWVEVLQEEWTEKVEDEVIDGEEPLQVYKREVIDHLLKQGHEDERVMQFVRTHLQTLMQSSTEGSTRANLHKAKIDTALAIRDLNSWLYEGMKNTQMLFSELPQSVVGLAAYSFPDMRYYSSWLGDFYDFWYEWGYYSYIWWVDEIKFANQVKYVNVDSEVIKQAVDELKKQLTFVDEKLRREVVANPPQTVNDFHTLRNRLFAASIDYRHAYEDALQKSFGTTALHKTLAAMSGTDRNYSNSTLLFVLKDGTTVEVNWKWFSDGWPEVFPPAYQLPLRFPSRSTEEEFERQLHATEREKRSMCEEQFSRFLAFYDSLQLAQFALSQNPLMTTASGLYQPRKRTQVHYITHPRQTLTHPRVAIMHPQRTYADMLNEVASQIANLPVYTAKVKITVDEREVEHTIKTLDPKQEPGKPLFGQALQDRIARIQAHNRTPSTPGSLPYCRSRQEVEAEIRTRQEQCIEPPPDEPPISRRQQPKQ